MGLVVGLAVGLVVGLATAVTSDWAWAVLAWTPGAKIVTGVEKTIAKTKALINLS